MEKKEETISDKDNYLLKKNISSNEKLKTKDPEVVGNIDKLKNQILYNNKHNEI